MIVVRFLYYNRFGILPDDYTEGNKKMIQAIILLVFLIFLNSVFAGAEIAVLSMNEPKMKEMAEEGDHRAQILMKTHRTAGAFYDGDPCNHNYSGIFTECFCGRIFCTAYDSGAFESRRGCITECSEDRMYDHRNNIAFLRESSVWRAGAKAPGNEESG